MTTTITLRPGDYILVRLGKDRAHVDKMTPDGARVRARTDLAFNTAHEIVRVGACENGGRMLICHVSALDDLEEL